MTTLHFAMEFKSLNKTESLACQHVWPCLHLDLQLPEVKSWSIDFNCECMHIQWYCILTQTDASKKRTSSNRAMSNFTEWCYIKCCILYFTVWNLKNCKISFLAQPSKHLDQPAECCHLQFICIYGVLFLDIFKPSAIGWILGWARCSEDQLSLLLLF